MRNVEAPVYSHFTYDIVPGETITVDQPDILIVEGLNVLQPWKPAEGEAPQPFVSDFFDFSIYLDADEASIRRWYIDRFLSLRSTSFQDPGDLKRVVSGKSVSVRVALCGRSNIQKKKNKNTQ